MAVSLESPDSAQKYTATELPRKEKLGFLILVLFAVYATGFIWKTSFQIEGRRYFSLFDDAMVSMQYARNFVEGNGLVWSPATERVEGYTNPLWVFGMSLLHLVPLDPSKTGLLVQISSAVFLVWNLFFVRKIALSISNGSGVVSILSVLLTAFYLPLNNWALQGTEVGVLTLITCACIWKALQIAAGKREASTLAILLGVSLLIRMDMLIVCSIILIFLFVSCDRKAFSLCAGAVLLSFISQTIFRWLYYGELLPNTYYLKLTGFPIGWRIARGLLVALKFIWKMNVFLFLLPFTILLVRKDKGILLLLSIVLGQIVYSIYVGGDAWESWGGANRYISIAMPIFFILLSYSFSLIRLAVDKKELVPPAYSKVFVVVFAIFSLLNLNAIHGVSALAEWALLKPPLHVQDNKDLVELSLILRKITNPRAKIAVTMAGTIAYFSERPCIDMLGKSDKKIAREKMRMVSGVSQLAAFYPGHLKWDYGYSIGQLKPDVVAKLWLVPEEADAYLRKDFRKLEIRGFVLYFRQNSPNVYWDRIKISG